MGATTSRGCDLDVGDMCCSSDKTEVRQKPKQVKRHAFSKAHLQTAKNHDLARQAHGGTELHRQAAAGNEKLVKQLCDELLRSGGDINGKDESGRTAFHLACIAGKVNTAQALLKRGADASTKDNNGKSAADVCSTACAAFLDQYAQTGTIPEMVQYHTQPGPASGASNLKSPTGSAALAASLSTSASQSPSMSPMARAPMPVPTGSPMRVGAKSVPMTGAFMLNPQAQAQASVADSRSQSAKVTRKPTVTLRQFPSVRPSQAASGPGALAGSFNLKADSGPTSPDVAASSSESGSSSFSPTGMASFRKSATLRKTHTIRQNPFAMLEGAERAQLFMGADVEMSLPAQGKAAQRR